MQTVNFQCGQCGNLLGVSADHLGQQVRCPHCQQIVVAPTTIEAPAPPIPGNTCTAFDGAVLMPVPPDAASIFTQETTSEDVFDRAHPAPLDVHHAPPTGFQPPSPTPEPSAAADVPDWMKPAHGDTATLPGPETVHSDLPMPPPIQGPRRSSMMPVLFLSLVFMPLVLYAVLATVLAFLFYSRSLEVQPQFDPREYLNDTEGDHPGAKKTTKTVTKILPTDVKLATMPLPDKQRIKIGETITLGDLRVKAERVEFGVVKIAAKAGGKPEDREALILRLHLTNVSKETQFFPMDAFFNRQSDGKHSPVPLTVLLAGEQLRFFGGPALWSRPARTKSEHPAPRYDVVGAGYSKELKPDEEMDTFVCTDGPDPEREDPMQAKFDELKAYKGELVWHVHLRRGFVAWKDHDYPATTVFGVDFNSADIRSAH